MISGLVWLYIWAIALLVVGGFFAYMAYKFYRKGRRYADMQEEMVKKAEVRLRKQYNRIATMEPKDFYTFLTDAFGKMLEIEAQTRVSNKDFEAPEKLYAVATTALMAYLGNDTVAAIEYYYGTGFIERWTRYSYRLLESRGVISRFITSDTRYESARESMM